MGVRPDIEMLTAVVIAGLLIITVIPPTSIILIAVAVPRTYHINTHGAPPSIDTCICVKKF